MRYEHADLIRAFVATKKTYVHKDFIAFYEARLQALETLFEVKLPPPSVFSMLFHSTLRSYLGLQPTRSGFLEDGLLNRRLMELPDGGAAIYEAERRANDAIEQAQAALFTTLMEIFRATTTPTRECASSDVLTLWPCRDDRRADDPASGGRISW